MVKKVKRKVKRVKTEGQGKPVPSDANGGDADVTSLDALAQKFARDEFPDDDDEEFEKAIRSIMEAGGNGTDGGTISEKEEVLRRREEALRDITDSPPDDALAVAQLVRAVERVDVYLRSGLDPDLLEDLMIAPVETDEELNRLVSRFPDGIVLGNAPQTLVRVVAD